MKKVFILLAFIFVALMSYSVSTVRTIRADKVLAADVTSPNSITWSYTGIAADSLTINQDTLLYNITINKAVPMNYYIKIGLDTIAGADTLCKININGRMFDDEDWTLIETVNTSAISAEINTVIESMTDADYTIGVAAATDTFNADSTTTVAVRAITLTPSVKPCWRQIQVEIIIYGDDSVGEGIVLNDLEFYFQEAK